MEWFTIVSPSRRYVIWVYGRGDNSVIPFTPFKIENLQELIEIERDRAR